MSAATFASIDRLSQPDPTDPDALPLCAIPEVRRRWRRWRRRWGRWLRRWFHLVPPGGSWAIDATGVPLVHISYKLVPTSKDQRKGGGWRDFPQFKNQGDCVSFVESDRKERCPRP